MKKNTGRKEMKEETIINGYLVQVSQVKSKNKPVWCSLQVCVDIPEIETTKGRQLLMIWSLKKEYGQRWLGFLFFF